jgi:hypothetical protein
MLIIIIIKTLILLLLLMEKSHCFVFTIFVICIQFS